ncbi:hypothetical protein Tco_0073987 [Tanacetum coccineum]
METKDTLSSCSDLKEQQMQLMQDKAKESCMVSFRRLHSHLNLLSNNDLKGTRTEYGFKLAFATLFGQDLETFTGTMFLNMDQLKSQLDKEEFQEIGSMAAFKVLEIQFQMFIKSQIYLDDEYVIMTHVDDADIRPIYDEEPMADVQLTADHNVFATGQQHTEQLEFNNEGEVDQNVEQCHDIRLLPVKLTDNQSTELLNQSLESENIFFKKEKETLKKHYKELSDSIKTTRAKTIEHTTSLIAKNDEFKAQLQEKRFTIAALKNELRKLKGNNVNTKISQPRFASQVDVNNDLSKPVTAHYLPKERESAFVKPPRVIASSESKNSSKTMPRFSSNDMVRNHYLEEAKKKTQIIETKIEAILKQRLVDP